MGCSAVVRLAREARGFGSPHWALISGDFRVHLEGDSNRVDSAELSQTRSG